MTDHSRQWVVEWFHADGKGSARRTGPVGMRPKQSWIDYLCRDLEDEDGVPYIATWDTDSRRVTIRSAVAA